MQCSRALYTWGQLAGGGVCVPMSLDNTVWCSRVSVHLGLIGGFICSWYVCICQ